MSYRVVYGETRPAWEKIFPTKPEANKFAAAQKKVGDVIYSIKRVVPGEPPQSLMAMIESARKEDALARLVAKSKPNEWRQDLLRLADGTRTLVEIAEQVKGYQYYLGGEYATRPTIDMVSSTLGSLRKQGHEVAWIKKAPGKPGSRIPPVKELKAMFKELNREKNARQANLIARSFAIKYKVGMSTIRQWMTHYYYNLS
jgi:hypothetical protein